MKKVWLLVPLLLILGAVFWNPRWHKTAGPPEMATGAVSADTARATLVEPLAPPHAAAQRTGWETARSESFLTNGQWKFEPREGTLACLVVNPRGTPQPGYPLQIAQRNQSGRFIGFGPQETHFAQTDDQGWVYFAQSDLLQTPPTPGPVFVVSGLAWEQEANVEITAASWEEPFVVLEVPNRGSLCVTFYGRAGEQLTAGLEAYVEGDFGRRNALFDPKHRGWMLSLPLGKAFTLTLKAPSKVGSFPMPGGLYARFGRTQRQPPDPDVERETIECAPLTASQPIRYLDHTIGKYLVWVRARLVLPGGAPLASRSVWIVTPSAKPIHATTQPDGTLQFSLAPSKTADVEVRTAAEGTFLDHKADLALGETEPGAEIDVGTVVLTKLPFVVAGRVIPPKPRTGEFAPFGLGTLLVEASEDAQTWGAPKSVSIPVDGFFRVLGEPTAAWYRLTLIPDPYLAVVSPESLIVPARTENSVIRVELGAVVTGHLTGKRLGLASGVLPKEEVTDLDGALTQAAVGSTPQSLEPEPFFLRFRYTDGRTEQVSAEGEIGSGALTRARRIRGSTRTTFVLTPGKVRSPGEASAPDNEVHWVFSTIVPPGVARVTVHRSGAEEPILDLGEIELVAGTVQDARLANIALPEAAGVTPSIRASKE